MKNKFSLKINIKRTLSYIVLLVFFIFLYAFLRSYIFLLLITVMTIMPVFSVLSALQTRKNITLYILSLQNRISVDEAASFELTVSNKSYFPSPECKIYAKIENIFFDSSSEIEISLPIPAKSSEKIVLPFAVSVVGCINIHIEKILFTDMLGIITFSYHSGEDRQTVVMPKPNNSLIFNVTSFSGGINEAEESKMKGSDFSEVTEIREYRPGDRLKDIHWKLTAKKDTLMVKERESLSQSRLTIVPDISGNTEESNRIAICSSIEYSYNLAKEMLRNSTSVNIMWWNESLFDFNESPIYDESSLEDAFIRLLNGKAQRSPVDVRQMMKSCRKDVISYVYVHNTGEVIYNV
ncbi:MAG: DUF58 domain-containing protein [Firmicutes bacterium]|nr:DUF58 domain-containing protein [Bacillota bacterium]